MADVFTTLSNMNGLAIARRVTALATGSEKSPDFEKGADHAAVIAFFSIGKLKNADMNKHVIEARRQALVAGKPTDQSTICSNLITILFLNPILARFGLRSDLEPNP